MTPQRCERYLALCELAIVLCEREDVPPDLRDRALEVLGISEKLTTYTPPKVRVEIELEPE